METFATPLSILTDKDTTVLEKLDPGPVSAFIDYDRWLANDASVSSETALSPSETITSSSSRGQYRVLQWAPHQGNSECTISVILEQQLLKTNSKSVMKIVFGELPLVTTYHAYSVPLMDKYRSEDDTTWITLAAKVPEVHLFILPSNRQLPISVHFYDHDNPDMVIDSREIGIFAYITENESKLPTGSVDGTIECDQLLPLLASCDDSLTCNQQHTATSSNERDTVMWLSQQIQQERQYYYPQYVFDNMNSMDASYNSNNLSLDLDSLAYSGYGLSTGDQNRQNLFSGIYSTLAQMGDPTIPAEGHHYKDHQGGGASSQADSNNMKTQIGIFSNRDNKNNSSNSNGSNSSNYVYGPASDDLYRPFSPSQANSKMPFYDNEIHNPSNTCTETGERSSYSMTSMHRFTDLFNKSNLKINGDLMQMTFQWTAAEWQNGRRLVRFWRWQNTDNVENHQQVECRFEPIEYYNHQQEQQQQLLLRNGLYVSASGQLLSCEESLHSSPSPSSSLTSYLHTNKNNQPSWKTNISTKATTTTSSLVVSCIYWKERNDYFITSVDCIYLLEGLIGIQFTVEEKNRIRRNLEGFRPLTISKCKPGCTDFFKLIMRFPHPKPRNIEKDVKVFAWKSLPHALRKIIRKYTPRDTSRHSTDTSVLSQAPPSHSQPPASSFVRQYQHHYQHSSFDRQYCY